VRVGLNHAANEAVAMAARKAALDDAGLRIEGTAKQTVHVITGNLRRSIRYAGTNPQAAEGYVEATASYSVYEHEGTRYRPPHPFFTEAIDREASRG
jgi:HK97 gp10 family phage protein